MIIAVVNLQEKYLVMIKKKQVMICIVITTIFRAKIPLIVRGIKVSQAVQMLVKRPYPTTKMIQIEAIAEGRKINQNHLQDAVEEDDHHLPSDRVAKDALLHQEEEKLIKDVLTLPKERLIIDTKKTAPLDNKIVSRKSSQQSLIPKKRGYYHQRRTKPKSLQTRIPQIILNKLKRGKSLV